MTPSESFMFPSENDGGDSKERRLIDAARRSAAEAAPWRAPAPEPVADPGLAGPVLALPAALRSGYEILRELHRGGQGVVYLAVQRATRRKVAVKVLGGGAFAAERDRQRFEREIAILGQLSHPGIVSIHDSGVAEGCHWFVMDYVPGRPLDDVLLPGGNAGAVPVAETLRLFAAICDAVNAAHLRGIVHRDLKPGNILIDADGHPRVLDFGLAKSAGESTGLAGAESERERGGTPRPMTVTGQFLGSLPWASPEQAAGSPDDIDLRSDVYSLGVLLYQTLTGRFPYEVVGNARDILDNIAREQPERPSSVSRRVDDEVETILLKALHKDRDRRYQSAGELKRDLEHYLAGEPIEAKRDSGWYVIRKTLRRYRIQSVAVAAVLVAVVGAGAFSAAMWRQARRDADRAAAALASRDAAVDFLLADMIGSVDPRDGEGRSVTVAAVLDQSRTAIDERFGAMPSTAADVHAMVGRAYLALGLYEPAERELRAALDLLRSTRGDPAEAAAVLEDLGAAVLRRGQAAESEALQREALDIRTRLFGAGSVEAAMSSTHVAAALARQGRHAEAEAIDRSALAILRAKLPETDQRVVRSLGQTALRLRAQGKETEAEPLLRRCVELLETTRGASHPDTAAALNNLATCLMFQGRVDEALPLLERSIAIKRLAYGSDDPRVATSLQKMAELWLYQRNDPAQAKPFAEEAAAVRRERLGTSDPRLADTLHVLGCVQSRLGEAAAAEATLLEALAIRSAVLRPDARQIAETKAELGAAIAAQGRTDEARGLLDEAVERLTAALGPEDPATLRAREQLRALATPTSGEDGRR